MTIHHNLSETASQAVEDDGPVLEAVIRMNEAAKAGKRCVEMCERIARGDLPTGDEVLAVATSGRAAYDRLAETRQRART